MLYSPRHTGSSPIGHSDLLPKSSRTPTKTDTIIWLAIGRSKAEEARRHLLSLIRGTRAKRVKVGVHQLATRDSG